MTTGTMQHFENLKAGSFMISLKGHLIEIMQLKKKGRQFVKAVDESIKIFLGCPVQKKFTRKV